MALNARYYLDRYADGICLAVCAAAVLMFLISAALREVAFCIFVLALFVLSQRVNRKRWRAEDAEMKSFAVRNGLQFKPGGFLVLSSVSGAYKGRMLKAGYEGHGGRGAPSGECVYMRLSHSSVSAKEFRLTIRKRMAFGATALLHGLEVGVSEFDKKYFVATNDVSRARSMLMWPEVRRNVDTLADLAHFPSLVLEFKDGSISAPAMVGYTHPIDAALLEEIANAMSAIADAIEKN